MAAETGGFDAIAGGATGTAFGFSAGGAATGALGATAAGFAGVAAAGGAGFEIAGGSGFLMAFRTSPGFEIFEKSNFGFGASAFDAARPSLEDGLPPFKNLRTRSASSSSTELE